MKRSDRETLGMVSAAIKHRLLTSRYTSSRVIGHLSAENIVSQAYACGECKLRAQPLSRSLLSKALEHAKSKSKHRRRRL